MKKATSAKAVLQANLHLFGTMPDVAIAKALGISSQAIARFRRWNPGLPTSDRRAAQELRAFLAHEGSVRATQVSTHFGWSTAWTTRMLHGVGAVRVGKCQWSLNARARAGALAESSNAELVALVKGILAAIEDEKSDLEEVYRVSNALPGDTWEECTERLREMLLKATGGGT